MGIKCGIVGLPNVGKSSLFNILSEGKAEAANYPFCTIEPNVGVVMVPDPRLDQLADINSPEEVIPSIVEFVDIAGLVEGASQGEGLGNKFLANIREPDAIIHVVRCFEDKNVTHVSDEINPVNDFEIINTKIIFSTVVQIEDKKLTKDEMEKIILIEVPNKIYPELRKIFVFLFENSGFKDVKISETVDFEKLYKMRKTQ